MFTEFLVVGKEILKHFDFEFDVTDMHEMSREREKPL